MLRTKDLYTELWKHSISLDTVLKVSSFKYCRHSFKTLSKIGSRYNITQAGFININTGKTYVYIYLCSTQFRI